MIQSSDAPRAVVPAEVGLRTKVKLAAEMLKCAAEPGELPYAWVTADAVYGDSHDLRRLVAEAGRWHCVELSSTAEVWTTDSRWRATMVRPLWPASDPRPTRARPLARPRGGGDRAGATGRVLGPTPCHRGQEGSPRIRVRAAAGRREDSPRARVGGLAAGAPVGRLRFRSPGQVLPLQRARDRRPRGDGRGGLPALGPSRRTSGWPRVRSTSTTTSSPVTGAGITTSRCRSWRSPSSSRCSGSGGRSGTLASVPEVRHRLEVVLPQKRWSAARAITCYPAPATPQGRGQSRSQEALDAGTPAMRTTGVAALRTV